MEPEKNDVDISKLFKWGKVFVVQNSDGEDEAVIYMKLLGDADVNRARVFALRKSAELRRKLLDTNSDERIAIIHSIEEMEKEDITNYIVMFSMRDIRNDAIKNVDIPYPKQPKSNAKLETLEKYQKAIDDYHVKKTEAINKYIKKEVQKLLDYFATETKETLYRKYVNITINELCEQEAMRAYSDMECYLGCYKDEEYSELAFKDFDTFDNLDIKVKEQFKVAYSKLGVGMDELKKLREVTQ